ncbi:MAG: hypothetical protein V2I97_21300 [Desulfococcaceae bacterium]|jgi:hypothetical protein|nr:hypothetical protein [Desulfococcaceae bacterium]
MDPGSLFAGVLFGSVGMAYMVYGKKQQNYTALLSGLGLCGLPYLISNLLFLSIISIALIVLPFIIKSG